MFTLLFSWACNPISSLHFGSCSSCYISVSPRVFSQPTACIFHRCSSAHILLLWALTKPTLPLPTQLFPLPSLTDLAPFQFPVSYNSFKIFFANFEFCCYFFISLFVPSPDTLRVFQWYVGSLRARILKLLHFFSIFLVDLICVQESDLNFFLSFRISGYSIHDLIALTPPSFLPSHTFLPI